MSYLVKNGTDVNQTDHRGMTALDTAAMRGNAAVAAELLLIPGVYIEVNLNNRCCKILEVRFWQVANAAQSARDQPRAPKFCKAE